MSKVSICIPTYNGEHYLEETLNAVLNQSYTNFEVIIVDDQSSDNTLEIVKSFSEKDNRINVFQNDKNLGLVGNWNKCIELAKGDWIKFVFQDDIIHPNCLELLMNSTNDNSKFIVCWRNFIFESDTDTKTKEVYESFISLQDVFDSSNNIDKQHFAKTVLSYSSNFIGEPTSTLIHKSIFLEYGLFNPLFNQLCDLEYWIRVGLNEGVTVVPEYLVDFRVHTQATSFMNSNQKLFRADELDPLLLLHEFTYNPYFSILHETHTIFGNKRNLKKEFAKKAHWVKNRARELQKLEINNNELLSWNELANVYPKLENSIHIMPLKLKGWIKKNFWWFYQ
ncbi:MAG: glycosyltransferase family 2 protein [Methylicorpusculum sp.]|uniref:glycosyltransferase family 2 protein n=1 Tax=Methylicorpusculum sp. TaxID=2713644 RepID=UPI0027172E6D|nr:glycosyltransferase family 2 protein [Methylicorpusculum sp.]MDO8845976.1 glycosyltransferase family 2 protein [Methylicorpusculum sp.]MDO8938536.1 glycosyltransferase family 2 protein [Methylicorpusculum sp.]MDP2177105.1 glycosyltransferase family 2 protein [Methylicorpusculum sp.]MDP2202086.1 glycosyltransferase family 2 protein [Methylicorpusculum sp.]MDP3531247.1 glycosyltransferase family 2 protein [Methylicorpusculum sp.]